jgi:Zn-dependent protease
MDLIYIVSIWLLPVLVAITFHEAAHGYVARSLGDETASRLGRVSSIHFGTLTHLAQLFCPAFCFSHGRHSYLGTPSRCR